MESGKMYALSEIFHGENNKVVIPDLQRDYCWGNPVYSLVVPFVRSLIEMSNEQEGKEQDITMGLIYGYYDGLAPEHLQLCDGQQRLTTLFLMIGVICRLLGGNEFRNLLMSDFELNEDDHEPYLQYAIRESSLYFLSDLTYNYFFKKGERIENVEGIRSQPWFLSNYRLDPTVNSILSATESIERILNDMCTEQLRTFGYFITTKIKFLFYDMDNRANGEETFVVINTTGEPLSATQNLKPLVIEHNHHIADVAKKWEDMETWFWQNRHKLGTDYPHTADEGMACFFNVVRLLYAKSEEEAYKAVDANDCFPYKEIDFKQIYEAFRAYKRLTGMDFSERMDAPIQYPKQGEFYSQKELYAIIPTMQYCLQFSTATDEDIQRVYHLFSNVSRYRDVQRRRDKEDGKLHSLTYSARQLVESMLVPDCLCLKNQIKDEEVIAKMDMIAPLEGKPQRKELELLFAQAEASDIFSGKIEILLSWSGNLEQFRHYWSIFRALFDNGKDGYTDDIVRRAIIASSWENYPIDVCYFGYKAEEWRKIIEQNKTQFRGFLDEINETERDKIKTKLEAKIAAMPEGLPWHEFAKHPELLEYCNTKHLYKSRQYDYFGWMLVQNQWARPFSAFNMLLLHELKKHYADIENKGWKIWPWTSWDTCVVVEKEIETDTAKSGLVIDIRCMRAGENTIRYNAEVFDRHDNNYNKLSHYRLGEFNWKKTDRGGCLANIEDKQQLFKLIDHCISTYSTLTAKSL